MNSHSAVHTYFTIGLPTGPQATIAWQSLQIRVLGQNRQGHVIAPTLSFAKEIVWVSFIYWPYQIRMIDSQPEPGDRLAPLSEEALMGPFYFTFYIAASLSQMIIFKDNDSAGFCEEHHVRDRQLCRK